MEHHGIGAEFDHTIAAGGELGVGAMGIGGGEGETRDAVGGDDQVVALLLCEIGEDFLPVADDGGRIDAPAGRRDGVALPGLEGLAAYAGDDDVLGTVLVGAVVDLAEEEIGDEFRGVGLRCEDGAGSFARAFELMRRQVTPSGRDSARRYKRALHYDSHP